MTCQPRHARQLAVAWVSLLLSACAATDSLPTANQNTPAPTATADSPEDPAPTGSRNASGGPAPTPTADATAQARYVSEAGGWSIALPSGWEVVANHDGDLALSRADAIAEVLVSPSWGLGLEQLKARTVQDLSAWPGATDVEAKVVSLPAGDAVWATLETSSPEHGPAVFILYAIDDRDHHYAISVRGPGDGADLLPVAEALAASFAIND